MGSLHLASASRTTPTQGLIVVEYQAHADAPVHAELELSVAGAAPAFRKSLELGSGPVNGWLVLHGHLLPNGAVPLDVRLAAGGETLAEASLTVHVRNEGETARQVAASLRRSAAPLVVDEPLDSRFYDYADPALTAWFDRAPDQAEAHLTDLADRGQATPDEIEALRHFAARGYLVVPGAVAPEHLARLNAALDDAVARKVEGYEWGVSQRIHDLHKDYPAIMELWLHPRVLHMLELIFGEPAKPCQTLTYVFGSEQQHHQDTIALTPFPAGRMCGVWTALEDIQPDSGELVVWPGSHRLDRVYMASVGARKVTDGDWSDFGEKVAPRWKEMIVAGGMQREVYRPKAGAMLIWHENLMHGGARRIDLGKSRRSIVGHYFARGAIAYYDALGTPGVVYEGETP
ncbi:MAG: phytanoyl-CoA dioxygenase family protein [Phenylobacterium sp.]